MNPNISSPKPVGRTVADFPAPRPHGNAPFATRSSWADFLDYNIRQGLHVITRSHGKRFGNPLELRTFIQMVLILEEMWCLESTQGIQKSTSKTEGRHHVRKVSLGFFSTKWNPKQSKTPISTLNSDLEKKQMTNEKTGSIFFSL